MIATTPACHPRQIFAAMRASSGPTSWQRVAEVVASGTAIVSGLTGSATFSSDVRDGRFSRVFHIRGMGSEAEAFDGTMLWKRDVSGGVHPIDAPFSKRRSITDAYLTRRAFLSPHDTTPATCIRSETRTGKVFATLRVQPRGGIAADLTVDTSDHLLTSISERLPTTTAVVRFDDYRTVDHLTLPFEITSGTRAEPEDGYRFLVQSYELLRTPHASDFAKPAMLNPGKMQGAASSTTVPLALDGRQLLVWASINGASPMPFILDTGGHAILTTKAAKKLGIRGIGAGVSGGSGAGTVPLKYASVARVQIGNALLAHQTFLIIDYPYSFYERGRHQPIAGILGLEVFERFATTIDYGRKRLTLTPFSRYHTSGAKKTSIVFQDDMPLAFASADGHQGLFGVDTGNAGTVILFGSFLERTGLAKRYPAGQRATGHGTGGSDAGRIVTLRRFSVGGHSFSSVPTFLTHMKSGSFSSWTEAGNFGYEILSRFLPTFDYARGTLYLASSPFAHAPPMNRAGFVAAKNRPEVFVVEGVKPGSPAAIAGVQSGDTITMIDGRPASEFSYGELYDLVTAKAGTVIRLLLVHAGHARNVTVKT